MAATACALLVVQFRAGYGDQLGIDSLNADQTGRLHAPQHGGTDPGIEQVLTRAGSGRQQIADFWPGARARSVRPLGFFVSSNAPAAVREIPRSRRRAPGSSRLTASPGAKA
jgi:hypothetical protein